jgi:hypothetical protein
MLKLFLFATMLSAFLAAAGSVAGFGYGPPLIAHEAHDAEMAFRAGSDGGSVGYASVGYDSVAFDEGHDAGSLGVGGSEEDVGFARDSERPRPGGPRGEHSCCCGCRGSCAGRHRLSRKGSVRHKQLNVLGFTRTAQMDFARTLSTRKGAAMHLQFLDIEDSSLDSSANLLHIADEHYAASAGSGEITSESGGMSGLRATRERKGGAHSYVETCKTEVCPQ